jgi:chromosome segregation ATPase
VVREIVGIFESLLDRLLMEKKQDTIRGMVAELMTEDLAATIADAHAQLKTQEMGHIVEEIKRLRAEVRDGEAIWEDRFRVTAELRDSQDDLWTTIDERCRIIESRTAAVENGFARRDELEGHVTSILSETEECRQRIGKLEGRIDEKGDQLAGVKVYMQDNFVTRADVNDMESRSANAVKDVLQQSTAKVQQLRKQTPSLEAHAELKASYEEHAKTTRSTFFDVTQRMDLLTTQQSRDQRYANETFSTKMDHAKATKDAKDEVAGLAASTRATIDNLEAQSATKKALEDATVVLQKRLLDVGSTLQAVTRGFDKTALDVQELRETKSNLATRAYASEVASQFAHEVAEKCSEKDAIALLRREFEEERERLRQTVRQQQHSRKDINETINDVHDLRTKTDDLQRSCDGLQEQVVQVDERVVSDGNTVKVALDKQSQDHSDLRVRAESLRDELVSYIKKQRSESDKLKEHSTQCYLEQIDKALNIQTKLNKVECDHAELNKTVRDIKLPKVAAQQHFTC